GLVDEPLRLGGDGAEHQRRLARPRDAGKHGQPPLGDLDADVLEVVLARALDADEVMAICGRLRVHAAPQGTTLRRREKYASLGAAMKRAGHIAVGAAASQLISKRITELDDWRGETLGRIRALIQEADPKIVEEWKWETPVWSRDGIVCTGETYKKT